MCVVHVTIWLEQWAHSGNVYKRLPMSTLLEVRLRLPDLI